MAVQFRTIYINKVIETGFALQKACLSKKIVTPQGIEKRMDKAVLRMENTCAYCKGTIKCLQAQCPVRYAHVKVINMLLDMDELLQKKERELFPQEEQFKQTLDDNLSEEERLEAISNWWYQQYKSLDLFPYVSEEDVEKESLEELLLLYKEAIDEANTSNTGLSKLKKLFGGN